jgi:hypothetical protein
MSLICVICIHGTFPPPSPLLLLFHSRFSAAASPPPRSVASSPGYCPIPTLRLSSSVKCYAAARICAPRKRDIETIDSELRLVAALRERGGPLPSIVVADVLLDERESFPGQDELPRWVPRYR